MTHYALDTVAEERCKMLASMQRDYGDGVERLWCGGTRYSAIRPSACAAAAGKLLLLQLCGYFSISL